MHLVKETVQRYSEVVFPTFPDKKTEGGCFEYPGSIVKCLEDQIT